MCKQLAMALLIQSQSKNIMKTSLQDCSQS